MLYIEPAAGSAPIVQVIQQARHTVDLNVYYLSSRSILQALGEAVRRGVQVRVILDEHPFGMKAWMVRKEADTLRRLGVRYHWAPARFEATGGNYVFDHAKYALNGHQCEIGTSNFDYSAFHRNREYLYVTTNSAVVQAARMVFSADWRGAQAGPAPRQVLVLSPGAAATIIRVIQQPGPVDIESEEMGDDGAILDAIAAKGALARVILPATLSTQDRRNVNWLQRHGVQVRLLAKRPIYMHAKCVVGGEEAFIGSQNFSETSLNENREMGLVLDGRDVGALRRQFDQDWSLAAG